MLGRVRPLGFVFFATLTLGLTSCDSNNTGKIVGAWGAGSGPIVEKFKSAPGFSDPTNSTKCLLTFDESGEFKLGFVLPPSTYLPLIKGKYKLLGGDTVELTDEKNASPPGKVKITIDGNKLSMTDASGVTTFTKVEMPQLIPSTKSTK